MAPQIRRADKQWRFVGNEVTNIRDLTLDHIRAVYGLGLSSRRKQLGGSDIYSGDNNQIFPYCENRYSTSYILESNSIVPTKGSNNTCTSAKCKEGNPHCLNYLGQDRWENEDAFDEYFSKVTDKPDPGQMMRHENTPAGMKNLGATCYANSLLQVWFHDLVFRDAIYRCRFNGGYDNSTNALYQLQLLFAFLDKGLKSYYNPLSLVESLKLDTAMQQDAQEFCNLFMAKIDNELHFQEDSYLGGFIKKQFQGKYSYQTTCKNCKNTSIRDCNFYELMLNIKDGRSLMDSFEEFVQAEELTGADQYRCYICDSLQDATREIRIDSLPNVLNIQLMRFVYDNTSWTKKKSKDTIIFPRSVDFSTLLKTNESLIYDLTAVLVHSGPGAHSGHFMAFVLDTSNDKWFILNDEEVTEFNGTKLDPEDISEGSSSTTQNKASIKETFPSDKFLNTLSSKNAYMLTYTKRSSEPQCQSLPPNDITDVVSLNNYLFEKDIGEYKEYKDTVKAKFDDLRERRRELYQNWDVSKDEDEGYYISSDMLAMYIQSENNDLKILDNSSIACEHQKLSPALMTSSKRISKTAMRLLEERDKVKVEPILTVDDLCEICTKNICQDKLYTLDHRQDIDEFERKAKGVRSPVAAWISKSWLSDWLKVSPRFHPFHKTTIDDPSPVSEDYVSDVFCLHNNLALDKTKRKQVNKAALDVIKSVFGPIILPEADATECPACRSYLQPQIESTRDIAAKGATEKSELGGMLMRGPRFSEMKADTNYFGVSKQGFIKKWHEFVKKPLVNMAPHFIDNTSLICKHDGFIFDLNNPVDNGKDDDLYVLSEEEWGFIQAIYEGGPTVIIRLNDSDESTIETTPGLCLGCRYERILDYSSTVFTIRVYNSKKSAEKDELANSTGSMEYSSNRSLGSKRKQESSIKSDIGVRRSKRVKPSERLYKEIKIPINKLDTVMELKLKIMEKTEIVPLYQKLVFDKVELENNESTISDLEIPPYAILDLFAFDQEMDDLDMSTFQDVVSVPFEEGGFGGTGLSQFFDE